VSQPLNLFGAALLVALLAVPAFAQTAAAVPLRADGAGMVLTAEGHHVLMPLPDWLDANGIAGGDVVPLVDATFAQSPGQATLDIIAKGDTAANWKVRYGARLLLSTTGTLADFRQLIMARYAKNCQPRTVGFFQLGPDTAEALAPLGFVCGAYFDGLVGLAGQGEVAVIQLLRTNDGYGAIYQDWRGAAFDPSDPKSWPVATSIVQARAFQLQGAARLSLAD